MDIRNYIIDHLNEEQANAALHKDTSSLILAGAGSGKTRTLTYKIAYLVYGVWIHPDAIFAVTFTNKAANEMKERLTVIAEDIEQQLNDQNNTIDPFENLLSSHSYKKTFPRIGTFHSLFLKFLKIELPKDISSDIVWYTSSFWVYDDGESKSLIKKIIWQKKLEEKIELDLAKGMISKRKNQGITSQKYATMTKFPTDDLLLEIYKAYEKELIKSNMMDFDDLLLQPYLLLKEHNHILKKRQSKFQHILVDEAQDTNRIQFELMKLLTWGGALITFIGDDFQSIYRRRGAMMDNFLKVGSIRPDMKMFKLQINYRSKPHIVQASNQIIKNNQKQYEKSVIAHRNGDDKIVIIQHGDEIDEAKHVSELIGKLKEEKKKNREQFAILYRKNALSSWLEQQLIMEGIPYKIYGGLKFLERKEVKDILSYIKYLANPKDTVALKRIINIPRRGISDDTFSMLEQYSIQHNCTVDDILNTHELLQWLWLSTRAYEACKKFATSMHFLKWLIDALPPDQLIEQIIHTIGYKEYLTESEWKQAQERIDNIGELVSLAAKYS